MPRGSILAGRADSPALAPFLKLELISRVHEHVVHLIKTGACSRSKHRGLVHTLCGLTGVAVPPDERDVEKIGNHADLWLNRKLVEKDRKLLRNIRNQTTLELKRGELRCACFCISAMGRLEEFDGPFDAFTEVHTRNPPRVPYTHSSLPPKMSMMELKGALDEATRKVEAAEADCKREKKRLETERKRAEAASERALQEGEGRSGTCSKEG
ncbi:MAG: hypothetical protein SGPRY_003977 [Prymnesium sp.]